MNITFVGDFCVKDLQGIHFGKKLKQILLNSQINVVNMEGPVHIPSKVPIEKSGPHLYQDPKVPLFLKKQRFNVISFANNHIMDFGETAMEKTKNEFSSSTVLGAGEWSEAYQVKKIKVSSLTIGFLAVTQYEFGVLDDSFYSNKRGTAWMRHPCIDELIINAKKEVDYLIILPHAGLEHFSYPLPELRTLYHHFIRIGADAIVASHPHVPQPWEFVDGKPILYSLGNFCFEALPPQNAFWNDGLVTTLTLSPPKKKIQLAVYPVHFNLHTKCIELVNKPFEYLHQINKLFSNNKEQYLVEINNECLRLEFLYDLLFEESKYIRPSIRKYVYVIWKRIIHKILKRDEEYCNYAPMINNIRCETHQWVLSRIYELKYKH